MSALAKKAVYSFLFLSLLILLLCLSQLWQNNKDVETVNSTEIQQHFEKSVTWLESSYKAVEDQNNPILWWMIKQAAEASGNQSLNRIYSNYKKAHLDTQPANLSTPMFDKFYRPKLPDISLLSSLQSYQIFFFYALSCDDEMASEPLIQKQMQPDFCSLHYIHPRCVTHQLMGLRFMQRYQCGFDETVGSTIKELQDVVVSELTWDFRVGDAYIQRTLMLVDSGAYHRVKPVWIKNILDAQNDDGSWDDLHPLVYLGGDTAFGLTSMLPKIQPIKADFHTTAQAIWLLSLLLEESRSSPGRN